MLVPLVNMIKGGCENESSLLILLICYLKTSQKTNLSLDNKNLKWGEISLWNKCFSLIHWLQLTAPFYSILFETSICQFNSSEFSPIMPDEIREHLTRDQRPFLHPESLQILQLHSSMTVLLLFSSPHSFSTGFRSEDWNGHSRNLVLCPVIIFVCFFEVCVWVIVLEDPNMAHYRFLTESVTCWFFYLLVFDRIHDAMYLNKMSRTSSRNIGPQHQKYSSIFHVHIGYFFIPVCTKPMLSGCC